MTYNNAPANSFEHLVACQLEAEAEAQDADHDETPTYDELHEAEVAEEAAEMIAAAQEGIYAELEDEDLTQDRRDVLNAVLSSLYDDCMSAARIMVVGRAKLRAAEREKGRDLTDVEKGQALIDAMDDIDEGPFGTRLAA